MSKQKGGSSVDKGGEKKKKEKRREANRGMKENKLDRDRERETKMEIFLTFR